MHSQMNTIGATIGISRKNTPAAPQQAVDCEHDAVHNHDEKEKGNDEESDEKGKEEKCKNEECHKKHFIIGEDGFLTMMICESIQNEFETRGVIDMTNYHGNDGKKQMILDLVYGGERYPVEFGSAPSDFPSLVLAIKKYVKGGHALQALRTFCKNHWEMYKNDSPRPLKTWHDLVKILVEKIVWSSSDHDLLRVVVASTMNEDYKLIHEWARHGQVYYVGQGGNCWDVMLLVLRKGLGAPGAPELPPYAEHPSDGYSPGDGKYWVYSEDKAKEDQNNRMFEHMANSYLDGERKTTFFSDEAEDRNSRWIQELMEAFTQYWRNLYSEYIADVDQTPQEIQSANDAYFLDYNARVIAEALWYLTGQQVRLFCTGRSGEEHADVPAVKEFMRTILKDQIEETETRIEKLRASSIQVPMDCDGHVIGRSDKRTTERLEAEILFSVRVFDEYEYTKRLNLISDHKDVDIRRINAALADIKNQMKNRERYPAATAKIHVWEDAHDKNKIIEVPLELTGKKLHGDNVPDGAYVAKLTLWNAKYQAFKPQILAWRPMTTYRNF